MKKYKFRIKVYISIMTIVVLCFFTFLISIYFDWEIMFKIIFAACTVTELLSCIGLMFSYTTVENSNLIQKSVLKTISIPLSEVKHIAEQPTAHLAKFSVGVYGINKKISITSGTKDCEELFRTLIDNCCKNTNIKIDSRVLEISKNH